MNDLAIPDQQPVFPVPGCTFLPNQLDLDDGLTFEQWARIGIFLQTIERGVQWWIGDWLNYGEKAYGEMYTQALRTTGYAPQTLANFAFVSRQVESYRRRELLPWNYHAEVAGLKLVEQEKILKKAEAEGWKRKDIRAAVAVKSRERKADANREFFDSRLEFSKLAWKSLKDSVQSFAKEYPRFSLYAQDFIDEVESELEDASTDPADYLMAKHGRGARSWDALVKATGFTLETVQRLVGELIERRKLKIVQRGGKTDQARGQVEDVIAAFNDPVGLDYRYKDREDEDDED